MMPVTASRLAAVRRYRTRHFWLAGLIDGTLTAIADRLPMCGHGRRHNWSVQFADLFFPASNGCGCCWFYRGIAVGAAGAGALAAAAALLARI